MSSLKYVVIYSGYLGGGSVSLIFKEVQEMLKMKKEVLAILFAALVTVLLMGLIPWNSAHALDLIDDKLVLDKYGTDNDFTYALNNEVLISAVSSDPSVAAPTVNGSLLEVHPKKSGHAVITVTDETAHTATLDVTVTANYINKWLNEEIVVGSAVYGSSKLRVIAIPGAKGTVTVGKKKYTVKALPASGKRIIKLKSYTKIKLNTKVVLKLKYDGQSASYKTKMRSSTFLRFVRGRKKVIKTDIEDLHKGDKIIVKYKGKTYTKKIKKNLLGKEKWFTFRTKHKVTKSASITVRVINKDKKTLEYRKCKLTDGIYPYDPAEDEEDEMDE